MASPASLRPNWDERAAEAIRKANRQYLEDFVRGDEPPKTAQNFYHLLEATATAQRAGPHGLWWNVAWEVILDLLVEKAELPHLQSQSPFTPFERRSSVAFINQAPRTLVDEVFELSLRRALPSNAISTSNDVAVRIWKQPRCQLHLLACGALQMCAEYGHFLLLAEVFEAVATAAGSFGADLKEVICQPGQRSHRLPALGCAILNGHLNCVTGLEVGVRKYTTVNGDAGECLYSYELACDDLKTPILHFTIDVAEQNLIKYRGLDGDSGQRREHIRILQRLRKIIAAIVSSWPESLLALRHVSNSQPPLTVYARAMKLDEAIDMEIDEHFQRDLKFGKLIYDSVFERLRIPHRIQEALYTGTGKVFELDLSDFNHPLNNFEGFVKELEGFRRTWVFEKTLLYLTLPDLGRVNSTYSQLFPEAFHSPIYLSGSRPVSDLMTSVGSPASRTLARFLDWLYDKKGVRTIFEVKIPDDHSWPLSESFVLRNLLNRFSVRKLDWRKLDIDLEALTESEQLQPKVKNRKSGIVASSTTDTGNRQLKDLKEINLYSSGNWGVLYHWASPGGLRSLPELEKVSITIVERPHLEDDQISMTALSSTGEPITVYQKRLERLSEKFVRILSEPTGDGLSEPADFELAPLLRRTWAVFTAQSVGEVNERAKMHRLKDDIMPCIEFLDYLDDPGTEPVPRALTTCVKSFRDRPVRIAIIDNGIDRFRSTIGSNIEDGVSFCTASGDESKVLPWWSASDPHGTQMAFLIRNINPYCKLFPARVGRTRDDIDPGLAVEAIKWAIKKKVDIISISWTTGVESKALMRAVKDAAGKNILIFCSTADEGVHKMDKVWPADCDQVVKVSASDRLGHARPQSQRDVDVLIDGDRLSAHGPSYMKNHAESSISGSSVATALVAGLASLCLVMVRLINNKEDADAYKQKEEMLKIFRKMQYKNPKDGTRKPFLVPSLLFKTGFDVSQKETGPPEGVLEFKHAKLQRS